MMDGLRKHIEQKFQQAKLEPLPFPHLVIEEFFPPEVYRTILQTNPFVTQAGEPWMTQAQAPNKTATPYWSRQQVNFRPDQALQTLPEHQAFWETLKQCFLGDDWFVNLVVAKFPEYFSLRFGELTQRPDWLSLLRREMFLQQHTPGFNIGPHTDIPTRIFTCIFAFADRPGFEEYGTELCVHRNPLVRCWGNNHHMAEDFEVRKVAPYAPNNFFLFFKTRQSFHAVKAIDASVPNRRYGMQFQLYEPPFGLFHDLSEPDLMVTKLTR